jgi:hypothetical protein
MAGSIISLTTASGMTATFRRNFPNATKAVYYTNNVYTDIMSQTGCVGIRIYNAVDASGNMTNVLVGVDAKGNDMYNGKVYNLGSLCPTNCGTTNPINS